MRNRLVGTLQNEDVLRVLDGEKFNATAAKDVGIVNYLSPDPYAKAVQFAQSFMQKAVQTPAEESKAFSTESFFNVVSKLATSGGDSKEDHQETKLVSNLSAGTVLASTSLRDPFPSYNASVLSIATAVPPDCLYTQAEIAKIMNITDPTLKRLFGASHIRSRNLAGLKDEQKMNIEDITQGYLINKHMKYAKLLARNTIPVACKRAGISLEDVEYIVITTSTGFVLPPLTAQISEMLGLRPSIQRTDIVGMGCHAGLNGMRSAANWVTQRANHGKYAVLACIEVCSAEYVWDPKTMQSRSCLGIAVTNSLFGDGASACVLTCKSPQLDITSSLPAQVLTADAGKRHPTLLGFESYLIPNSLRSMYMDWQDSQQKYSFLVMPEAPYLIGLCIPRMINNLLDRFSLPIEDVSHWIVHSGGKKSY
jgi:predicted naringenin-chalcone synthase